MNYGDKHGSDGPSGMKSGWPGGIAANLALHRPHCCCRSFERIVAHSAADAPCWCAWYLRLSVTIPAQLAVEVERVARKKHLTRSQTLVVLAQRGVEAEATARANFDLSAIHERDHGNTRLSVRGGTFGAVDYRTGIAVLRDSSFSPPFAGTSA